MAKRSNANVFEVTYKVCTPCGEELRTHYVVTRWSRRSGRGYDPAVKVFDFLQERNVQVLELVEVKEVIRQAIL